MDILKTLKDNLGFESVDHVEDTLANSSCAEEWAVMNAFESVEQINIADAEMIETIALADVAGVLESNKCENLNEYNGSFMGVVGQEASVTNIAKRGYYGAKIQVKNAIKKVWSIIKSIFSMISGGESNFKKYSTLIKKYADKLAKVHPKATSGDKDEKEVKIRLWDGLKGQIDNFVTKCGVDGIKAMVTSIKGVKASDFQATTGNKDVKTDEMASVIFACGSYIVHINDTIYNATLGKDATGNALNGKSDTGKKAAIKVALDSLKTDMSAAEEKYDEIMSNQMDNLKDRLADKLEELKDIDEDTMDISEAQNKLLSWARQVEAATKNNVKFKREYDKAIKTFDKVFGEMKTDGLEDDNEVIVAGFARMMAKNAGYLTQTRNNLTKYYKAIISNIQGLLADISKVTAKLTTITE